MTRATSRRLDFTPAPGAAASRTAAANSSGTRMLSRNGDTEIVPGLSGRKASSVFGPRRAAATPASESSNAIDGGGSRKSVEKESGRCMASTLDERHLVDLFQGADALSHLFHGGLAQERHALF